MIIGFNCQLDTKESQLSRVSVRDCLHWAGLFRSVGEKELSPPWAAPFPRRRVLNSVQGEESS